VKSNGAFASGMLVENSEADLSSQYMHLFAGLRPLFECPRRTLAAQGNAKDNAAGAVARMICKNMDVVPLDQVHVSSFHFHLRGFSIDTFMMQGLPILLSTLPLKNDFLENWPVFRAVFHLMQSRPSALAPYIDQLLSVLSYVLNPEGPDQLGNEMRQEVLELVGLFNLQAPEKVQAGGWASISPLLSSCGEQ
jgi:importin-4